MGVRLFVAVEVPDDVRTTVARAIDDVRTSAPEGLRWSDPSRWHLTLAFLGEVADQRLSELGTRLARAVHLHRAPTLRIDGAGRFGSRTLWARIVQQPTDGPSLPALVASVAAAARRTGIAQEDRPYRPHLTLARARTDVDLRPLVDALAGLRTDPWTAHEVLLVRSRLGPHPEHVTLESFAMPTG